MSYEPTLIILKQDLDKHEEFIIDGNWQYDGIDEHTIGGEDGMTLMNYIKHIYTTYPKVNVGGMVLIICTPRFSSFNKLVRAKLDELNVEYGESN